MAILAFQKPDKVIMLEASPTKGTFEFRPLEQGYGVTIGNALRRVLLGSLEGYAITSIKISGVDHEFATVPGVITDVTNMILNLKQVRFKHITPDIETESITLQISNSTAFMAGDLNRQLQHFEVLNPDLLIAEMDVQANFKIDITINKGRGWMPAEENRQPNDEIGVLAIDSIFTPIVNVKYSVEDYRVEQITNYEKLTLEITTDGSISPKDALREAANILIYHFMLFSDDKIKMEAPVDANDENFDDATIKMRQILNSKLTDMDLSVRALNCLKAADVETMGQLVSYHRSDLLKFRNFGKKSLTELDELLEKHGLQFGMDVSKYKLDKE
ncbi:MAG: DNA-directed RNA polymerase subunit alpha [Paludibacteraceae bacterium]|nr:DNA-directed RNA polymerase subunit alpha [Paludibacteraceae bacterium]